MLELKDILTMILALYGATLSTILAIREAKKEKRNIKVFLDYYVFQDRYKLSLVNVGYRPITLVEAGVRIVDKKGITVELRPAPIFGDSPDDIFPILLNDGAQKAFNVSEGLENPAILKQNRWKTETFVRDAEGNIYRTTKIRSYNSKLKRYD